MKLIVGILILVIATASQASVSEELPFYTQNDFTPVWKGEFKKGTALAEVPSFQLKNQNGQVVSDKSVRGKVTVLNFFYASCGSICPAMMTRMNGLNKKLSEIDNVEMLSITVTPKLDTPEKLAEYAQKRRLDLKRWSLLTGEDAEIRRIEKALMANKDVPSKKDGESVHSENIYLLDQEGKIRGIYNASSRADLELLVGDARQLSVR